MLSKNRPNTNSKQKAVREMRAGRRVRALERGFANERAYSLVMRDKASGLSAMLEFIHDALLGSEKLQ